MMEDNITPEEKLLKIIENSGKAAEKGAPLKGPASLFKNLHLPPGLLNAVNVKFLSRLMFGVALILTVFLILDFRFGTGVFRKRLEKIESEAAVSYTAGNEGVAYPVNLLEVVSSANKRNIFTLIPAGGPAVTAESIQQETQNLKLVGIIWSETNPQAMIEDSKTQKTYILNSGEYVGLLQLKKIFRDKVVLGQGEIEWELR